MTEQPTYDDIIRALEPHGLIARGGFHPAAEDEVPGDPGTLVLVGNVGPAMWRVFRATAAAGPDPLDNWTRRVVGEAATALGATALFPFGGPPYLPFQRWGARTEGLEASPLGVLIHPEYGLWHAYRAALAFGPRLALPQQTIRPSPCASCVDRPCLDACPVGAFSAAGYDVPACVSLLRSAGGEDCMSRGCQARRACPVGPDFVYDADHAAFHMAAFLKARLREF
jgi:hypothetical protein